MVADLRYFNSFKLEVDSLKSQLETQKTQFLNEIDRLFREYYYADHMNAILGMYTELDEVTNLQCDYLKLLEKCECLEKELSNNKMMSKSFEALQKHAINLEIDLQQYEVTNLQCDCLKVLEKSECLENELSKSKMMSKSFEALQKHAINLEIDLQQYLKAQLQDKGIVISELKKLIEKLKGKFVDTKFEKSSVIRQPNAFKSQRPSILGKPTTFSNSFERNISQSQKVIPTTSVSRPQLKSNPMGDRVTRNNSQGKKQEVEEQRRNVKLSKNKTSVTLVEIVLFIVDSGCSKHMTGNLNLLINLIEKFLGTVKFRNDQIAPILGYGDLVQRVVTIKRVYYVEGLNDNLFSVGQFCDADLEVAFRKSTCYIRVLKGNDLLTGSRGTDLYSITLQDTNSPSPICLMAKATSSQAWLWHRRLSYLNFDTINLLSKNDIVVGLPKLKFVKVHLCSSCELGKAKQKSFHTKITPSSKRWLQLLHMDLYGLMRVASINGKRYVLVIVDDYSRYTWTHFLRSKDETLEVLIDFLKLVQKGLQAQRTVLEHDSLSPGAQCQKNVTQADKTVTTSNELDFLFSPMFDEMLNGSSKVVSKSFAVTTDDDPNQCQQQQTPPLNNHITPESTCHDPTQATTVASNENMNQAEMVEEYAQVKNEKFINIFYTPVQDQGDTSSRHVDSSNMHTFYQHHPSEHRWTKDDPLEQVIGNLSQSV
nr:retrovirus-related Pol polyprotein from transposon TNT 1-94 [Tanacetum cinerariifolium]